MRWWCIATIVAVAQAIFFLVLRSTRAHQHHSLLRARAQPGNSVDTKHDDKTTSTKKYYQVIRRNQHGLPAIIMGDDLGHIGFHDAKDAAMAVQNHEMVHENAKRSLLRIMRGGADFSFHGNKTDFSIISNDKNSIVNLVARGKPYMSKDGSVHVRFQQEINGYLVEGAFIMVHTNPSGQIVAVNGEFVQISANNNELTTTPSMDAPTALAMAMREAEIDMSNVIDMDIVQGGSEQSNSEPKLAMVVDSNTGEACFAWKSIVEHYVLVQNHNDTSNKSASFQRDAVYADAHDGHLCALHPQIVGLANEALYPMHYENPSLPPPPPQQDGLQGLEPVIQTLACEPKSPSNPKYNQRYCYLYSNATRPISPNDNDNTIDMEQYHHYHDNEEALCKAHNYALATYRYYWDNHGLWSINGQGMPIVSFVLNREFEFDSAYWNGESVTFGDGLLEYNALSLAADIVAHEFTHGVTQYSSGLVYHGESGALNEAISDIFGALIDRQEGASGSDIWLVGENTARNGYIRDMADPASRRHFDYYPTRYQGPLDMGGVHWNSGIVNLAFKLLVMGGTHPRKKSSVHVRGLIDVFQGNEDAAFQTAGDIFFCANNECLTPTATFEDARFCTTIICGATGRPQDEEVVHCVQSAWFAVGVGSAPPPIPTSTIHEYINALPEEESWLEQLVTGEPTFYPPATSNPSFLSAVGEPTFATSATFAPTFLRQPEKPSVTPATTPSLILDATGEPTFVPATQPPLTTTTLRPTATPSTRIQRTTTTTPTFSPPFAFPNESPPSKEPALPLSASPT